MEITAIRNPEPCRKHSRILLFQGGSGGGWLRRRREGKKDGGAAKKKQQEKKKAILYFQRGERNPGTSTFKPKSGGEKKRQSLAPGASFMQQEVQRGMNEDPREETTAIRSQLFPFSFFHAK